MGNAVPGTSLTASNLLYNPALRNSPSPQPPPRIPTQAKDPPKPAAPAYQRKFYAAILPLILNTLRWTKTDSVCLVALFIQILNRLIFIAKIIP